MLMQLRSAVLMLLLLSALTGGAYPLLVTVLGQVLFADQASGSLIQRADGSVVGSRLIAQKFTGPEWFQPRPSAGDYATISSSASNLAKSAPGLRKRIETALPEVQVAGQGPVPQELRLTQSETLALLDFTRQLSAASDRQAVISVTLNKLGDATRQVCLLLPGEAGQLVPQPAI